jgi:putative ABC transport system permease protein
MSRGEFIEKLNRSFTPAHMQFIIAWRNLAHDRMRFFITLVGITFSTILMGIQLGMLLNVLHTISIIVDHSQADLWIAAEGVQSVDLPAPIQKRRQFQAMAVDGVALAEPFMFHFAMLKRKDGVHQTVIVLGVEPGAEMGLPFSLEQGANPREALLEPDGAIIDRLYAEKLGVHELGDTFEIHDHRFRVTAFTKGVRTFTQAPYVYTSLAKARSLFPRPDNEIAYVLVRVADGYRAEKVAAALSAHIPDADVLTADQLARRSQYYWLVTTGAGVSLISSTLLAVSIGVVIVAQTLYASTTDRLPEYAVIRAMGGARGYLYKIIVFQAIIGGIIGAFIGLAITAIVVFFTENLSARPEVPLWLAVVMVITMTARCVLASLSSLRKIMMIDPVKVFR